MARVCVAVFLFMALAGPACADFGVYRSIPKSPELDREIQQIAEETLLEFASSGLSAGNLSISLIDLTKPGAPVRAGYREEITYHPASVVKLLYLITAYDLMERGKLQPSSELDRAIRDMIVVSGNDGTSYVVDVITGTTSGRELPPRAFRRFQRKRNVTNRYFHARGYDINANGKTWCDDAYGREKQLLGPNREHRNRLTSAAAASLMYSLINGRFVSASATEKMLALMKRPLAGEGETADSQVTEFIGAALPPGSKMWSKAGWTNEVRHDVAYVELPDGGRYVLAIFTRGASGDTKLIPAVSAKVVRVMRERVAAAR